MSKAILRISAEILRERFNLPDDCVVHDIDGGHVVRVEVDHESIPADAIEVVAIYGSMNGEPSTFCHFQPMIIGTAIKGGDAC